MKIDLSTLSHEQVGALHGRIHRSIEGYVRFLRISFLDFFPATFTGGFALMAALSKQPRIALIMAGVIPVSVLLTIWQLITQKGIRLGLLRSREAMDGTVVEQLTGIDYVRAANTHRQELRRVEMTAEQRRVKEIRHHFEMSLFGSGKALNEAIFHLLVIAFAIYLFFQRSIGYGDIMMFSILFLNIMSPLHEIHRFVDEAHESSLRMGDLLEMLAKPIDRSFYPKEIREPRLDHGAPLFVAEGLQVTYRGNGCDLLLMSSVNDVSGIPKAGQSLIIVAVVDQVLHFRIFDDDGKVVVDTDEKRLKKRAQQIEDFRKQLESLWPPHELTKSEKAQVIAAVTSIVGHTRGNKRALDGVSMSIWPGETIGVAGRSGSGKSTWLRVVMRLTHPSSGSVMLGGVPLECVSREAIGRLVGYVGQNPFVFAGTIAENIAYGNEGAGFDLRLMSSVNDVSEHPDSGPKSDHRGRRGSGAPLPHLRR